MTFWQIYHQCDSFQKCLKSRQRDFSIWWFLQVSFTTHFSKSIKIEDSFFSLKMLAYASNYKLLLYDPKYSNKDICMAYDIFVNYICNRNDNFSNFQFNFFRREWPPSTWQPRMATWTSWRHSRTTCHSESHLQRWEEFSIHF